MRLTRDGRVAFSRPLTCHLAVHCSIHSRNAPARSWKYILINGGYMVVAFVVMGLILGAPGGEEVRYPLICRTIARLMKRNFSRNGKRPRLVLTTPFVNRVRLE